MDSEGGPTEARSARSVSQVKYCNIEGVFLEQFDKVTVVSDKMKAKGRQSYKCWEKDQVADPHSVVVVLSSFVSQHLFLTANIIRLL